MTPLLQKLAAALERPRELTPQVVKHLGGTYGVTRDAIGPFLSSELPRLEDYETDVLLSPVYTPKLQDQAEFADFLGQQSVPRDEWQGLVRQLVALPTRGAILVDGVSYPIDLREVSVARFVERLRLDGTIADPLFNLLNNLPPAEDRPQLKAVARRAIWENTARREILFEYLTRTCSGGAYRLDDTLELLKLAETYQPAGIADLLARIPQWQQILEQEIEDASRAKPFFNARVQEMHGGGRDQRPQDNSRIVIKKAEAAFLERLARILGTAHSIDT